ncbi:MAG: tRNA(Ile)(2)-agmatinylcytidine synthase [Candidatus Bathyarchaeia archaeon]
MDSEGTAVETVNKCPTWFTGLVSGSTNYFLSGQGVAGITDLAYPMPNQIFGDLFINQLKIGKAENTHLIPSYVPLAITEVKPKDKSVAISYKGIGGGSELIRLWSSGALRFSEKPANPKGREFETEYPLYRKIVIGVDDTDSSIKGATFSTALQLASILDRSSRDFKFLRLTMSFNWPANPAKTTNNSSSGLVFAVKPGREKEFVFSFERLIRKATVSKQTSIVVMEKIRSPDSLKAYARKVKREKVTVDEAFHAAEKAGVKAIPITGERGLIGALAVVGLIDNAQEAITPINLKEETKTVELKR